MNIKNIFNTISILDSCSEIFNYPTQRYLTNVKYLGNLTDNEELKNFSLSYDLVESEYIKLFSVNATSNKTVPNASWWIDGKMMGRSFVKINDFYKECGFVVDLEQISLPQDHISLMISFLSILLEEKKIEEVLIFIDKYLKWLDKFEVSLKESTDICIYPLCVGILKKTLVDLQKVT